MPPKKRSALGEPSLIAAVLTFLTAVITGVFGLVSKSMDRQVNSAPGESPTPLPASNEYAAPLLSEAQKWPLIVKDTFESNKLDWYEGNLSSSKSEGTMVIDGGTYVWNVKSRSMDGSVIWPRPGRIENVPDFYAAVDVESPAQPDTAKFGITFRNQGIDNHYEFTISSSHKYDVIYKRNEDPLISSTSKQIVPFERNRIAVIGIGHQLWFYINDVYVDYVDHNGPLTGNISLVVAVANSEDQASVSFDDFELRERP
jgi:hypothetical protein